MIDAFILAGGYGTRSRAYLGKTPKVLAPLGDVCLLGHLLAWLAGQSVTRAVLALGHGRERVLAYPLPSLPGLEVRYHLELEPRGTVATLRGALAGRYRAEAPLRTDPLLIVNGDTLVRGLDLSRLIEVYRAVPTAVQAGDSGVRLLSPTAIAHVLASPERDLERALEGYEHTVGGTGVEYVDVGTAEGYARAKEWFR